jgi:4-alpha-glucanotransferase
MSSIHLVLGSHNSQVLDLPEADQNAQYEHAIKPFLKLLYNRRDIRFTLYYSGLLLEWLERHHSEFVDVLTEMVKRKQVELLGGAFFEPMLPLIPKTDRIGQIERMTTHLRKCFGRRPRGAWIPEGIWDQRIAASLNTGGLDYALLRASTFPFDDPRERFQTILTEDQGKTLTVVPVAWRISETLFSRTPEEIITFLEGVRDSRVVSSCRENYTPTVALMFDGANVGYKAEQTAITIAWYERFLDLVSANADWIRVNVPGRIVQTVPPTQRRYAPLTSFLTLMDWLPDSRRPTDPDEDRGAATRKKSRRALPASAGPPVSEGSFRSIMETYPESARLYARMQHTHVLVNQIRGDKYRKMTAREELWRGQSHFAYWHNRSGGIYRSTLRKATYAALIEAEKTTRERGVFIPAVSRVDVDLDGREEVLYQGNEINAYLHRFGGRLFELDHISRNWNYLDTFRRRREPFHDDATIAAGYDSWDRSGFVDHFLHSANTAAEFARGDRKLLCNVTDLEYEISTLDKDHNAVVFNGRSTPCAEAVEGEPAEMTIRKSYRFIKSRIETEYNLTNAGDQPLEGVFAVELNLSFHSLEVDSLRLHARQGRNRRELTPDMSELEAVSDLQFHDLRNSTRIQLTPEDRPDVWCFPVEAVGYLGDRLHWFYQSNCCVFRWKVNLLPGESRRVAIATKLEHHK